MKIIDATDMILGRMATSIAKMALNGESVTVVNCEKAIIVGKKKEVIARYKQRYVRGTHTTGPYLHRMPDRIVRRTIRGMIPYKTAKGRPAFESVMCYIGVPDGIDTSKLEKVGVNITDTTNINYISIGDLSKELGAKL